MRHTLYFLLSVLSLVALLSCESGMDAEEMEASVAKENAMPAAPTAAKAPERKIVRQANLRFQVKNLTNSSDNVEAVLAKYNATLANSKSYTAKESIEAVYTIKVAPENFFALVKAIQNESTFLDEKTITADDVTLQYVDTEARIRAKQAVQARYLQLLSKASKIDDILTIETELQKVQEELESVQAQLKALQRQTAYSTIRLTMYQFVPATYTDRTTFGTQAMAAFTGGWQLFKDLVIGVLYLWPLLLISILFILGWRWQKRRQSIT